MARPGARDVVAIAVMVRSNLGDAHALIVPSTFRALCRAICLRLLLDRAFGVGVLAGAGCRPWPATCPAQDWSLVCRPRRDERQVGLEGGGGLRARVQLSPKLAGGNRLSHWAAAPPIVQHSQKICTDHT